MNDLSTGGMGLFSIFPIAAGATVSIQLDDPLKATLKAKIVWCQEYAVDSHILSENSYAYRLGVKFLVESPAEAESIRNFCEKLWSTLYGSDAA